MRTMPKSFLLIVFVAFSLATHRASGDEPAAMVAQTGSDSAATTPVQDAGGSEQANPQVCNFCFQQLQKDNRECEALEGQDWQICREAATTAYNRCSRGC